MEEFKKYSTKTGHFVLNTTFNLIFPGLKECIKKIITICYLSILVVGDWVAVLVILVVFLVLFVLVQLVLVLIFLILLVLILLLLLIDLLVDLSGWNVTILLRLLLLLIVVFVVQNWR